MNKSSPLYLFTALLLFASASQAAVNVSVSYSSSTSNTGLSGFEDAVSATSTYGYTGIRTVDTVGESTGNMGYRHYGGAAGRGMDGSSGDVTQYIRFTTTWTVEAEEWEEYSITMTPQANYRISLWDENNSETDDSGVFPTLSTQVKVNGVVVSDTLGGLTGATITTDNTVNYNRSDSQTFSGYTGNNTFSLYVYGNVIVNSHQDGGLFDDESEVAVMWGRDMDARGIVYGSNSSYAGAPAANASQDGLFIDANVTLDAVPEPGTFALIAGCFGFVWVMLRRR